MGKRRRLGGDITQTPRLTAGEAKRAQKLLDEYLTGKVTYAGESVLEKMENVIVGVYALDPAQYDGEQAYVILPGVCMTDEQLLSIISAFDELELVFDPDGLNYRNCSRGGGIETSRFFNNEESKRYSYLANCIKRGLLMPPEGLEGGQALMRRPELQSEYFCGMTDFTIRPYRRMTDEEMISLLVANGIHDERVEIDHGDVEARSRNALYTAFCCPLSMELNFIYTDGSYVSQVFTADVHSSRLWEKSHSAFGASFAYTTEDGIPVHADAMFDKGTNELIRLFVLHDKTRR